MKRKIVGKLIKLVREGVKNDAWLELFDGGYLYPCEEKSILSNLRGEGDCTETEDYLLKHDDVFYENHIKFRSIIDNKYLNPYKEYELPNYYVKPKAFDEVNILFKFLEKPTLEIPVVLIGEKGSGKTALQNCWLYQHNDKLEEKNVFWVRCDGHKLFKQWINHLTNESDINEGGIKEKLNNLVKIEEYLDIQLLYVFSKYCLHSNRKFFKKIIDAIEKDKPEFYLPISRNDINETRKQNLYEYIKSLNSIIVKTEHGSKNSQFSYAFDRVMQISGFTKQFEKRKWLACSEAFQNFLKEKGYWILRVVDGMDNLHINDESSKIFYENMLKEAVAFIKQKPIRNCINFMAIRERTFIDMAKYPLTRQTSDYTYSDFKIYMDNPSFKDVIYKRYDFSINKFFTDGEIYDTIAIEVIKKLSDEENKIFHNNTRSFLYNKVSLIASVYYRLKQLKHQTNIASHVQVLENRNRFLNGSLFLSTRKNFDKIHNQPGVCSINIFYFDFEKYPCYNFSEWHGLCKTRILQLLSKYNQVEEQITRQFISSAFGYEDSFVTQNIKDLRAFGLIDSISNGSHIMYILSDKGRYEFEEIYSDIDTLYYFGLDSFLPKKLIENGFILSHSNKFERKTNYPVAAVCTALTFIVFLHMQNEKETNRYGQKKGELLSRYGLFLHESELKLNFRIKILLKRVISMFKNEDHVEYHQLESFLSKSEFSRNLSNN